VYTTFDPLGWPLTGEWAPREALFVKLLWPLVEWRPLICDRILSLLHESASRAVASQNQWKLLLLDVARWQYISSVRSKHPAAYFHVSQLTHISHWTVLVSSSMNSPQPTQQGIINVETSSFTQLKMCCLVATFRCPWDILITCWLFTARWSTWPGNYLVPCVAELVGSCIPIHAHRCLPDSKCLFYPSGLSLCLSVDHFCCTSCMLIKSF